MNEPQISEIDFQREKLKRDLQDVVNMLGEASSETDTNARNGKDLLACFRFHSIDSMTFVRAAAANVGVEMPAREGGGLSNAKSVI